MGIGSVIKEVKERVPSVKEFLLDKLTKVEQVPPMKPGDWIRVSALPKLCPREEVLAARMRLVREMKVFPDLEWWWGVGEGMHYTFQSRYLGPKKVLLGSWICLNCGRVHGGPGVQRVQTPEECAACRNKKFVLKEETLTDDVLLVKGHIDGVLLLPGLPTEVVDFKSCSAARFEKLKKEPDPDAVLQLQVYMHLMGLNCGRLVFINKQELHIAEAIAEHIVNADERKVRDVLEGVWALRKGLEGGPLPDQICSARNAKRAVGCACKDRCFLSGDGA